MGACLGTIAILEVSPSKSGVVDLSGAYPVGHIQYTVSSVWAYSDTSDSDTLTLGAKNGP